MKSRAALIVLSFCAALPVSGQSRFTTLGGQGFDAAYAMAVDTSGNIYIAGDTDSMAFSGTGRRASRDAFVAKLDPTGTQTIYVTYFGGSGTEGLRALAIDASGNAYVAGYTNSTDFVTTGGAISSRNAGFEDAFAAKLNPSGTVVYSTLLGSSGSDQALGIAVDGAGNMYVTGQTAGAFPTTAGVLQSAAHGSTDCFVSKVNPNTGTLVYSTLLGGNGFDSCRGIAIDSSGNAYVAGVTYSTDFPVQTVLQTTLKGFADAFVAKINPSGTALVYSTFLGGDNFDEANAITVDTTGAAYVAGDTTSWNFPVTQSTAQATAKGGYEGFVAKLPPEGNFVLYATLIGGSSTDIVTGVTVDGYGRAVISGFTNSTDFPLKQAIQSGMAGYVDAFLTVVDAYGSSFLMSTYAGGSGDDRAYATAIGSDNRFYAAGYTQSPDFPGGGSVIAGNTQIFIAQSTGTWQDPPIAILVNPGSATLSPSQTQQFTVSVSGPNAGVVWSVSPAIGSMDVNGLYIAPSSVTAPQTVTITATSLLSRTAKGSATVTLIPRPPITAQFVKLDAATQGSWKGVYGADGYNVIDSAGAYPTYLKAVSLAPTWTWAPNTTDVRALQQGGSTTQRIAATWYTTDKSTIDLTFSDSVLHHLAVYCLDWDSNNLRAEKLEILDAIGNVLDTRTVTSFSAGTWAVWNVSGHVQLRMTNLGIANAVVSGLFFGPAMPPSGTAQFLKTDLLTQGSWKGVYGTAGYNIINNSVTYPPFVKPVSVAPSWTWTPTTTDARALQQAGATTQRIAATWYATDRSTVDLAFTDTTTHQLEVYCLDWDSNNLRSEKLEILDGVGNVLDTRTVTSFSGGIWMVWSVSGHVQLRMTNLGVANAVISGLFFDNIP